MAAKALAGSNPVWVTNTKRKSSMKVKTFYKSCTKRGEAVKWMDEQYAKYSREDIVTSNFAEDNNSVTAYITVCIEPKKKPEPEATEI